MKTRILPALTTQKMQALLLKMNSQTKHESAEKSFSSKILAGLMTKDGIIIDSTAKLAPVNEIYEGRATIEIGKKIELAINPLNGNILQSKKPWYLTWKKVNNKIDNFIINLQSNFDNEKIVEKRFITLGGVTQKGKAKLVAAHKKLRLEGK